MGDDTRDDFGGGWETGAVPLIPFVCCTLTSTRLIRESPKLGKVESEDQTNHMGKNGDSFILLQL